MLDNNEWDWSGFWTETLNQFRKRVTEQEWAMWFSNLSYISGSQDSIRIAVPSSFYKDQISQRYGITLIQTINEISGRELKLIFEIINKKQRELSETRDEDESDIEMGKSVINQQSATNIAKMQMRKTEPSDFHYQLNPDYTFETFVIGENNSFAANAAYAIANNPGTAYNPCLFFGNVGLGKTHLIQAIGHALHKKKPELKIVYVTAETFTNEFVDLLLKNKIQEFKNKYRKVDVLLIDDIHFFQGKDATQEELFHTFNALYESKKQIVFTCDRPISEIKNLTDRLRNRFERGLNIDLKPPDFETRQAILMKKMKNKNVAIPSDVIELVCQSVTSNVRDLEAALLKLLAYSELVHKEITLDNARKQLQKYLTDDVQLSVSIDKVQKVVSNYFNVSLSDLKGKKRTKVVTLPRQVAMYIIRELTEYSTTEIGCEFNGRDHTTVMHACLCIENKMKADSNLELAINNLIRAIREEHKK